MGLLPKELRSTTQSRETQIHVWGWKGQMTYRVRHCIWRSAETTFTSLLFAQTKRPGFGSTRRYSRDIQIRAENSLLQYKAEHGWAGGRVGSTSPLAPSSSNFTRQCTDRSRFGIYSSQVPSGCHYGKLIVVSLLLQQAEASEAGRVSYAHSYKALYGFILNSEVHRIYF